MQAYTPIKRLEHGLKSLRYDGKAISVVEPNLYAKRFTDFMRQEVFCPGSAAEDEADDSAVAPTQSVGLQDHSSVVLG